jgi:hypothetical protein
VGVKRVIDFGLRPQSVPGGGRIGSEQVADFRRNRWPQESVTGLARIPQISSLQSPTFRCIRTAFARETAKAADDAMRGGQSTEGTLPKLFAG